MSLLPPATATGLNAPAAPAPAMRATVQHLMGTLWYEMLSAMNDSGLDPDALGAGGSAFQGSFLWNIAQNDFSKYDSALTTATLQQIGGRATATAASAPPAQPPAPGPTALPAPAAPGGAAGLINSADSIISSAPLTASAPAGTTGPGGALLGQATNFARNIWPGITTAAQKLGVPAIALLAQSALETGWGSSAAGNNLFGVKAVDGESGSTRPTQEVIDGVLTPQMATFRDYASTSASISDYVGQILSGFQNVVGQNTVGGFAQALQTSGYATDTNYAAKIISVSQSPMMARVLQAIGEQNTNAASNSSNSSD